LIISESDPGAAGSLPREQVCANFLVADDPYHDYINGRQFLRQWFVLGPFSYAEEPFAVAGREHEALDATFVADESTLQPVEDEKVSSCTWQRYSAVSVMSKWWELTPERVLLRNHHELKMPSTEPPPSPPGGVHLTIDDYTLEHELMPCWGELDGYEGREPFCPRCEKPIVKRPDRCPNCEQRVGFYTSYSAWGFPRRSWWQPVYAFDYSVTYIAACFHAAEAGQYTLRYSTNNPCIIWINGSEIARYDGPFLFVPGNQTRKWDLFESPAVLEAGWNSIVVKAVLSTAADGEAFFCARFEHNGQRLCVNDFTNEVVAQDRRLHIKVDQPTFIGQSSHEPWVCRMSDGSLVVSDYVSRDDGRTWVETLHPLGGMACIGCRDGTDMVFPIFSERVSDGVFQATAQRSPDGWRTVEEVPITFRVPQTNASMGEDGIVRGPGLSHGVVRLDDGALLGSGYGYLHRDNVYTDILHFGWEKYHHSFGLFKYSSWAMISRDDGLTWDYQGCIPPAPASGDEGFCEPDFEVLENGDIVAILRNGEGNAPLWLSYSSDQGKSWTMPAKTRLNGQHPSILRMSNGLLVASYGRPDNRIAISLDGRGDGFSHEIIVSTAPGWQGVSAVEIAPDELFVVYEDLLWEPVRRASNGGRYKSLVGSRVKIEIASAQ
jgi:hypothetical protein